MATRFELMERAARKLMHDICLALAQSGDTRVPQHLQKLIDRLDAPEEGQEPDASAFNEACRVVTEIFNEVNCDRWGLSYVSAIFVANLTVGESTVKSLMRLPGCLALDGWWNILDGGDCPQNRSAVALAQSAVARELGVSLTPKTAAVTPPLVQPAPAPAPKPAVVSAAPAPVTLPPQPRPAPKVAKPPRKVAPVAAVQEPIVDLAPPAEGKQPIGRTTPLTADEVGLRRALFSVMCGMKGLSRRWDYSTPKIGLRALAPAVGISSDRLANIYEGAPATEEELQRLSSCGFKALKLELLSQPLPSYAR